MLQVRRCDLLLNATGSFTCQRISWRPPSITLHPVHWCLQGKSRALAPCGTVDDGRSSTSPSWSRRRSLQDITSLPLSCQNLRGNHLMVGARCPTKVSTQQHSAWAPARPSPASSVISQKCALMNVPFSKSQLQVKSAILVQLCTSLWKKRKSHMQKLRF